MLRDALQIKIEQIHRDYDAELRGYEGDSSTLDPLKPDLHNFLDSHDGSFINRVKNLSSKAKRNLLLFAAALCCLVLWVLINHFEQRRWDGFIASLEAEPGIVITHQREIDGVYNVYGIRDPLAVDPDGVLKQFDTNRRVDFQLEPYHAIQSDFILLRAKNVLSPPGSVELSVAESTLYISGNASKDWIEKAKPLANTVVGAELVIFNVRTAVNE